MAKKEKQNLPATSTDLPNLPSLGYDSQMGLKKYIQAIQKFPYLTEEQEQSLAKKYKENNDQEAAKLLISSHLRLVVKIAYDFKNYGLPLTDLISEGNIGLIQAVKKFEPEKGFRLTTYAMWWIKAFIQDYILSTWSLVKISSSSNLKKLFFGLKKSKEMLNVYDDRQLSQDKIKQIAQNLNVDEKDVIEMNSRMQGDYSLNVKTNDEDKSEHLDFITSNEGTCEDLIVNKEMKDNLRKYLLDGLHSLTDREQEIIVQRRLSENPATLKELGQKMGISQERIRQIENSAFEKLKKYILSKSEK
ncbi:MAG: RNA polymerase sigma factor RpoH [Rickettsiales bacterium]|jgi:RNA polymerase sigma-32 factor|nr:RNA polymerase sigma factor RpoH [Rickettsiales bacterium]